LTYNHASAKYLPIFLESLRDQTFKDFKILTMDNSDEKENKNSKYIRENYPEVDIEWSGENLGFAKGQNKLIKKADKLGADYYMVLNPDTVLEKNTLEILVKEIERNGEYASISPKILKWDFGYNIKTDIVDSCGIELKPGLRFVDIGQGKTDIGQFDEMEILGPSGASGVYSMKALRAVRENWQYFDERMFMYKEDCDLNYRLFLHGFKSRCQGKAVMYHDRTSSGKGDGNLKVALNRFNKSKKEKRWSFINQHLIFKKYWKKQNLMNKINIIIFEIKAVIFISIFERFLLKDFYRFIKGR